jgi:hypothetical protein
MLTYFHPEQLKHHPQSYLSRGKMRTPQEVPERALRLVEAARSLGFDVREPADAGVAPLAAVHGMDYLRFLEEAHAEWTAVGPDWGNEVMSNVFVREGNSLRGVLAEACALPDRRQLPRRRAHLPLCLLVGAVGGGRCSRRSAAARAKRMRCAVHRATMHGATAPVASAT